MSKFFVAAAALFAALMINPATSALQAPPPLEDFARLPHMAMVQISPDGQQLAFISTVNGNRSLIVRDIAARRDRGVNIASIRPQRIVWGNNSRLLLSGSEAQEYDEVRGTVDFSAVLSFDLDNDFEFRQLLRNSGRTGDNYFLGRILGVDRVNNRAFIPAFDRQDRYDLLAANFGDRGVGTVGHGTPTTRDWVIDENGQPVARVEYSNTDNRQRLLVRQGEEWVTVQNIENATQITFSAWGLLPDGNLAVTFYATTETGARTRGLFAVSLENGDVLRPVFHSDEYDVDGIIEDPYTNRTIGVTYDHAFTRTVWFDEEIANYQSALAGAFPDYQVTILNWSQDRSRFILSVENERNAPLFFMYDVNSGQVALVGSPYGQLGNANLPARNYISFNARDDTKVYAYVTQPEGEGPFPTVVLPHGGPASRDVGGFDYLAHFLATRGYAVIQPNFRGSSGYGAAWEVAGYGQWGTGVMQHDVTDALAAMVDSGVADPDRTCIMGWSYGGYSALAGAAFTPDLYQCAVSIAGVGDVPAMLRYSRERYGRSHWSYAYWSEAMTGNEDLDSMSVLRDVSPRQNADQITAPVLLIHGDDDSVVPESQSRFMERALRRANVPVTYIELDGGGHSLVDNEAMRLQFMAEIERFLAEHIGE